MRKLGKIIILLLLPMLLLAGCWDMVEIDMCIFTGILGIDTSSQEGKYTFYFSFPIAREIFGQQGGGGGGGEGPAVGIASTVASSIVEGARNLRLRLNREIYFEHMRIVIISEEVARQDLRKIIDPLNRDKEFNRRSRIAIVEGDVKKVIEVKPWIEKLTENYLEAIFGGNLYSGKFYQTDLDDFFRKIDENKGNVLLSRIRPDTTEVNIGGAAVIKNYRLAGWLDEDETQSINFILGKIQGGDITVAGHEKYGTVSFTILGQKRKVYLKETGNVPVFGIDISIEGNVMGTNYGLALELDDIKEIEDLVSKQVKNNIDETISKIKDDYRVDLLGLGEHLRKYEPDLWEQYEKEWEQIFPHVQVDVRVNTAVKNVGTIL